MPRREKKDAARPRSASSKASARRATKPVPTGRAGAKSKTRGATSEARRGRKTAARTTKPKPPAARAAARKARTPAREAAVPATVKPATRTAARQVTLEAPPPSPAPEPRARPRSAPARAATARTDGARRTKPRAAAEAVPAEPEEAAAAVVPPERFALPETYGKTRVRVLMQSPGRLFVHWDLSPGVIEELKAQFGQRVASLARLAIRITTPGAARPLLVLLPRGARSWYVDVPGRGREYRAEIGLMLPSGEFRPVAAGNVIRMPRTAPSPVPATRRATFQPGEAPPAGAALEIPADVPSGEEALLEAAEYDDEDEALDEPRTGGPGGSSEMSAGGRSRRPRARAAGPGGPSDLAAPGSSSDLRPRRKPG